MKSILSRLLFALGLFVSTVNGATLQTINVGTVANDPAADTLRSAFGKVNANDAAINSALAQRLRLRPVQMANRCVNPTAPLTLSDGTNTQGQARIYHRLGAAGYTSIQFKYVNRSNASANITDNLTGLGTLTVKAAMEYPATSGVIYPITFNGGAATVVLPPGAEIWSDPLGLLIPTYTGTPPNTDGFYERVLVLCPSGAFVRGNTGAVARGEGVELGTSLTDKVYSGTFTTTNNLTAYGAVAIRGIPLNRDHGSVVVLMDSLASGVGASSGSEDRGFGDKAFSGLYGVCNVAVSGGTLAGWTSTADARYRRQIINDLQPSLIIAGCGGNDLNNSGATAAQVIALLQKLWTQLKTYNCPIVAWTIPPRTTSLLTNVLTGATTQGGNPTVTMASTAGAIVGQAVSGTGIAGNATISSISTNVSITLSAPCTASGSGITLTCTSSDSWRTYANQAVNSPNTNWEAERLTLNTYLRTQAVADGYVAQVIDFAATVEDGGVVQSGRWKTDGTTANLYTSDGAHPNDVQSGVVNAQALIGALINTSLAAAVNTQL